MQLVSRDIPGKSEKSENQIFLWYFQGIKKETSGMKKANKCLL